MKTKIVTSRKWSNVEIEAFVSDEDVGARIDLTAFLNAVVEHVGNPTLLVTKQALRQKLEQAAIDVMHEMRGSTRYVV